jgi:hypothetical protein
MPNFRRIGMTNAAKHANASVVELSAAVEDGYLNQTVRDDRTGDAQDRLGVGSHDQIDIVGAQAEGLEGVGISSGRSIDRYSPRCPPVFVRKALDRLTDRRCVHHRHQFGQVLCQYLEVQHLVAMVKLIEQEVTAQIC